MTVTIGSSEKILGHETVSEFIAARFDALDLDGRSLCLVIPDAPRRCPVAPLLAAVEAAVRDRVRSCTAVIALGTHAPMSDAAIAAMAGPVAFPVVNHRWSDPDTFVDVGTLSAATVSALSQGLLDEEVGIRINRLVTESDVTVILGPVLPHEVVGFSGGNKYLFPGLSGQEVIDVTHWLGALLTSAAIIGTPGVTPVRALIDAAASLVPGERHALCVVVDHATGGLHSLSFGPPPDAWAEAVEVAAVTHIRYLPAPVTRVLSLVAPRYADLWTGAKGFYKVEPVVADGGEVVLYAPHITQIAPMHPEQGTIGYHCRDYLLARWDDYKDHPRGELAHSTHLYGAGSYDPVLGERQRVRVTLATGIPEEVVRRANLGYLNPAAVDVDQWTADPGALVVPDAGEVLYRVRA
jgi:lactate racemase